MVSKRNIIYSLIILLIIAIAVWNYQNTLNLFDYSGSYSSVEGEISRSTYIGKGEVFGPHRVEVQLSNGDVYIVLAEDRAPQLDKGDQIILQLPAEEQFLEHGKETTNKYQVTKVNTTVIN